MRVLTIFCGILLMLTGIFALGNPGASFISVAFVIGSIMLFFGFVQVISYVYGRLGNDKDNNSWILIEGLVTLFLGVIILSNQLVAEIAVPLVFGLWLCYSGIMRIVAATYIDRFVKPKNFYSAIGVGALLTIIGGYTFFNPTLAIFTLMELLGIIFIAQGISTLELGINMPHARRAEKVLKSIETEEGKEAENE